MEVRRLESHRQEFLSCHTTSSLLFPSLLFFRNRLLSEMRLLYVLVLVFLTFENGQTCEKGKCCRWNSDCLGGKCYHGRCINHNRVIRPAGCEKCGGPKACYSGMCKPHCCSPGKWRRRANKYFKTFWDRVMPVTVHSNLKVSSCNASNSSLYINIAEIFVELPMDATMLNLK